MVDTVKLNREHIFQDLPKNVLDLIKKGDFEDPAVKYWTQGDTETYDYHSAPVMYAPGRYKDVYGFAVSPWAIMVRLLASVVDVYSCQAHQSVRTPYSVGEVSVQVRSPGQARTSLHRREIRNQSGDTRVCRALSGTGKFSLPRRSRVDSLRDVVSLATWARPVLRRRRLGDALQLRRISSRNG